MCWSHCGLPLRTIRRNVSIDVNKFLQASWRTLQCSPEVFEDVLKWQCLSEKMSSRFKWHLYEQGVVSPNIIEDAFASLETSSEKKWQKEVTIPCVDVANHVGNIPDHISPFPYDMPRDTPCGTFFQNPFSMTAPLLFFNSNSHFTPSHGNFYKFICK